MTVTVLELQLIYGPPPAPGDPSPTWPQQDVVDLLNVSNFSVDITGWVPKIATAKQGGVYLDSGVSNGRELVNVSYDLVDETMQLVSRAASYRTRYFAERRLRDFSRLAQAYHVDKSKNRPVYLKFRAKEAPGPQYSIVHRIDFAPSRDALHNDNIDVISVVIQRDPYWRPIPPRTPPIAYTFEHRGQDYTYTDLVLGKHPSSLSDAPDLVKGLVQNRTEWNVVDASYLSKNYIKIPAADIPGEGPALVQLAFGTQLGSGDYANSPSAGLTSLFVARTTRSPEQTPKIAYHIPLADGTAHLGAKTIDATWGVFSNGSTVSKYVHLYDLPAATTTFTKVWSKNIVVGPYNRGKYVVFLRHVMDPAEITGTLVRLVLSGGSYSGDSAKVIGENRAGHGTSAMWDLTYLGTMTIPLENRDSMSPIYGRETTRTYTLELFLRNTSGAIRTFRGVDLVLVPIDEGAVFCEAQIPTSASGPSTGTALIYDETGYLSADGVPTAVAYLDQAISPWASLDSMIYPVAGSTISLEPGVDNWLIFVSTYRIVGTGWHYNADVAASEPVSINIVPQWLGVRDQL